MAWPERPPVYADENLDRFLVATLRQRGFDVLSTQEAGRRQATDEEQLAYATSMGCVLLTHNRGDFVRIHHAWIAQGRPHAGIATLPQIGPVGRRAVRASLLINWMATEGRPLSRLAVWGHLQTQLQLGLRPEGYTVEEVRLALGLANA